MCVCIAVASAAGNSVVHVQVKCSALRHDLFDRVSAILDGCGAPGTGDTLLRAEVHNQLRRFSEDFSSEPQVAVFMEHIGAHYAARPGEHYIVGNFKRSCLSFLPICEVDRHSNAT